MQKENRLNVPNALSLYRLVSFPFLLYLIFTEQEALFAVLLCINLVTDILDGLIARVFKLQTEFGARLDSLADYGTYILAFMGIYAFKYEDMGPHMPYMIAFASLILLYNIVSLVKFRRFPSLHLYATKIGGYVQGFFFFCLFTAGFYKGLFYTAMGIGYYATIEELIILMYLPQMRSNAKGLYWVLKDRPKANA